MLHYERLATVPEPEKGTRRHPVSLDPSSVFGQRGHCQQPIPITFVREFLCLTCQALQRDSASVRSERLTLISTHIAWVSFISSSNQLVYWVRTIY
jgi:hypothetical protein